MLALGDSHVRVFEHWSFLWWMPGTRFEVVHVPGASALGVNNPGSVTQAHRIFREALQATAADLVVVHLGEVDTAYTIWKYAERRGRNPRRLVRLAVERYWDFILEVRALRPVAVLSACLPTLADQALPADPVAGIRSAVRASQRERTALALEFNRQLAERCRAQGIPFLDTSRVALGEDGLVRPEWVNPGRYDHHYARAPFARWLAVELRALRQQAPRP